MRSRSSCSASRIAARTRSTSVIKLFRSTRLSPAEARLAEFEYRRIHSAAGQFIAEPELAREADAPLIDVLRRHIRGFTNLRDGRVVSDGDIPSQLDVYVNGLRSVGLDV